MKWVVYLLLAANVAFFAHQYYYGSSAPPPPPPAVRPFDHVNRLLLMDEVDPDQLRLRQSAAQPAVAAAPAVEAPAEQPSVTPPQPLKVSKQICYSIGPLRQDAQISAMRTWLVAIGGSPILRVDETSELERYWVYFPPRDSREEAQREVERMRAEGLSDVIAVPSGDMTNAISLGVFSQRSSLERRLQELRELGYEPLVMPRYRSENASWFDVSFNQGGALSLSEVAARFPQVEVSETACTSGEIARDYADF